MTYKTQDGNDTTNIIQFLRRRFAMESARLGAKKETLLLLLLSLPGGGLERLTLDGYEAEARSIALERLDEEQARSMLDALGIADVSTPFLDRGFPALLEAYVTFARESAKTRHRLLHAPHESRRLAAFCDFELKAGSNDIHGQWTVLGGRFTASGPSVAVQPILRAVGFANKQVRVRLCAGVMSRFPVAGNEFSSSNIRPCTSAGPE
jgi:hypothetical protein